MKPGEIVMVKPGVKVDQPELAAWFRASPEFLARLLQLPEGAEIDAVDADVTVRGELRFRIRGAGWPTPIGHVICESRPLVHTRPAEAAMAIEWDFQKEGGAA